jgi:uncharacterized membrane protein
MSALFPAALHPQVVHFAIVLVIVGVAFRLVSLLGRPAFASPAATTLLLLAALSAVVSVRTGTAAHGPVERVPGSRPAVMAHEEAGEQAQVVLLVLGLVELVGFAMRKSPKVRMVHAVAAVAGLAGVYTVYEAGERGGELVYSYAGGVGIRSGDPKDIQRLLLAGSYQQAMADRAAGRAQQAADLIAATAERFPADPEVRLLAAESLLVDQKDAQAAIDGLTQIQVPADNRVLGFRKATLLADAYQAAGQKEAAIAALESVLKAFPNARLQRRVDDLKKGT